jgi:hypothetical protein
MKGPRIPQHNRLGCGFVHHFAVAFAISFSPENQVFLPFFTQKKCSFLQVFEEFSFCISSP